VDYVPRYAVDNADQMKRWLRTCISDHRLCKTRQSNFKSHQERPTRLLELTKTSVRLQCDPRTISHFDYLTLSHVWGTDAAQQLRLSTARLEAFQKAIPVDELPAIFKEAIRITRHIGYKYLWIDSLCIIQDSSSDWTTEASTMASVYSNAVCNIAFLFPPEEGFSRPRPDPRSSSPCIVRTDRVTDRGCYIGTHVSTKYPWLQQADWPSSSRAWIFQEHLLSPRTIFYGQENIMWECTEVLSDELLGTRFTKILRSRGKFGSLHVSKTQLLGSTASTLAVRPSFSA
jgi:hypothetical protein